MKGSEKKKLPKEIIANGIDKLKKWKRKNIKGEIPKAKLITTYKKRINYDEWGRELNHE